MKMETLLAQAGSRWDDKTGAISMPIYQAATFRHPALGQSTGYDYSRTINPTRQALEDTMAKLDDGTKGFAFSSGMAAIDCVLRLFKQGDRIALTEDPYGGTIRLFEKGYCNFGIKAVCIDTTDLSAVKACLTSGVKAVFIESPTNPLLKIADIKAIAALAKDYGALTIIDNTFCTPLLQKPLDLGADIVVYSASKYLSGHNDVVAGIVVAKDPALAEQIGFFQNAVGAVLGPQDSWLVLRGLKTLPLRLQKQQENAITIAEWLNNHQSVKRVYYPGLENNPGHRLLGTQFTGPGAVVSFEVNDPALVPKILSQVKVFIFAESLGGLESLVTFPAVQTHSDIPLETRERLGINDRLLRLSIGIEHVDDLINDLAAVLDSEGTKQGAAQ
jgi:cystathionine gamma-synthase/cystathionine beta-lyase